MMDKSLSSVHDETETSRETSTPSSRLQRETRPHVRAITTRRVVQAVELVSTAGMPEEPLQTPRTPAAETSNGATCSGQNVSSNSQTMPTCAGAAKANSHHVLVSAPGPQGDVCVHTEPCRPVRMTSTMCWESHSAAKIKIVQTAICFLRAC